MNKKVNSASALLLLIGIASISYRLMMPVQIVADGIVHDNLGLIVVGIWTILSSVVIFTYNVLSYSFKTQRKKLSHESFFIN